MPVTMAERKKAGRPKGRKPYVQFSVRLNNALHEALKAFVQSQRPAASANSHFELAIEEYLSRRNAWPKPG